MTPYIIGAFYTQLNVLQFRWEEGAEGGCSAEAGELRLSDVEEALAEDLTERDEEDIAKECAEFNIQSEREQRERITMLARIKL